VKIGFIAPSSRSAWSSSLGDAFSISGSSQEKKLLVMAAMSAFNRECQCRRRFGCVCARQIQSEPENDFICRRGGN
jgi:hypothetical protein